MSSISPDLGLDAVQVALDSMGRFEMPDLGLDRGVGPTSLHDVPGTIGDRFADAADLYTLHRKDLATQPDLVILLLASLPMSADRLFGNAATLFSECLFAALVLGVAAARVPEVQGGMALFVVAQAIWWGIRRVSR